MILRILAIAMVAMSILTVSGCKKSQPATPAETKITAENLDAELDKMEKEVDADVMAEEQ